MWNEGNRNAILINRSNWERNTIERDGAFMDDKRKKISRNAHVKTSSPNPSSFGGGGCLLCDVLYVREEILHHNIGITKHTIIRNADCCYSMFFQQIAIALRITFFLQMFTINAAIHFNSKLESRTIKIQYLTVQNILPTHTNAQTVTPDTIP